MLRLQTVSLCAVLAATASMQFVAVRNRQRLEAASGQTYGRYTQQQAIELAAPICRAMLPRANDLFMCAEPKNVIGHDGKTRCLWSVECGNAANPTKANVVRDAETGAVLSVGCEGNSYPHRTHRSLFTAPTAVVRAQDWMRILDASQTWHAITKPQHIFSSWHIELKARNRYALIMIDDEHGQLLYASIN